ncbi:hypothetical protein J2Z21_002967 [Streptomyces griseochromogenes]|uniref:Uncharacterized protein n=1 Tax=Streptomyces griseochromogenes TaxID=68214 RepID=A0A1B1AXH4_9ACTN|nr:hypothetical protein [Streptomyces griseochromogenes]ANP51279.1 hypothetical protein AVL59_18095 [Streptomyces griseochromogenes]MBP2050031.1 hypothetical protein [Streptomyces griseochromogenes]
MTVRPSSPGPYDDSAIPSVPVPSVYGDPVVPSVPPVPSADGDFVLPPAQGDSVISPAPSPVPAPDPGSRPALPQQESLEALAEGDFGHADPLHDLVHMAVADRPLEDVARLITLLEESPEHARTMSDALRAVGVDRPVEDVTRLVALLTQSPRDSRSADEAIRAAAECRSVEDVIQLMELLHRTPVEPRCARAAIEAAAVHRPVEELAELIARLAASRTDRETPPLETTSPAAPAAESAQPESAQPESAQSEAAQSKLAQSAPLQPEPTPLGTALCDTAPLRTAPPERVLFDAAPLRSAPPRQTVAEPVSPLPAPVVASPDPARPGTRQAGGRAREDELAKAPVLVARAAALMVFLCGVAHAPRYWADLSQANLQATLFTSGFCALLALALLVPAVPVRLPAATAALGVTVALATGQVLGGRFGLPDPARLRTAHLAPPWLAGTTAAAAALTALTVLLVALTTLNFRRGDGPGQTAVTAGTGRSTK